jgi:hypothetical protein
MRKCKWKVDAVKYDPSIKWATLACDIQPDEGFCWKCEKAIISVWQVGEEE